MFGRRKKGPNKAFSHDEGCKILAADPDVSIPWNETRTGHWEARCQCGVEYFHEPAAEDRVRLDPLDPKTSHHLPQCEFASETEPSVLKLLLKINDGAGGRYWWVECGACDCGWQVPHNAANAWGTAMSAIPAISTLANSGMATRPRVVRRT